MTNPRGTAPADTIQWKVEVVESMPDVTDLVEAHAMLASPTKMKEWRSSDFAKMKITTKATEPLQTGTDYQVQVGPMSMTASVSESTSSADGPYVFDAYGVALFGAIGQRLRMTLFRNDDGIICGKAQEVSIGSLKFLSPSVAKMTSEHKTMFQELNTRVPRQEEQQGGGGKGRNRNQVGRIRKKEWTANACGRSGRMVTL